MKRFAAQLDKIAPEEYNVNEVALQQANSEAEWWNTEDAEAWSDPEMVAELYDFNLQWQKMRESESNKYDQIVRCIELAHDSIELSVSLERAVKDRKTLEALTSNLDSLIYILSELKQSEDQSNDFSGFFREDEDE